MAHLSGHATKSSLAKAAKYCRLGAEKNGPCANYCVARVFFEQGSLEQIVSGDEAEQRLRDAANVGHTCAASLLALSYFYGAFPSEHRLDNTEKYLRLAASKGGSWQSYNLGQFLVNARGQNLAEGTEAYMLLRVSASNGNLNAACVLAKHFLSRRQIDATNLFKSTRYLNQLVQNRVISEAEAAQAMIQEFEIAARLLENTSTGFIHPDFPENSFEIMLSNVRKSNIGISAAKEVSNSLETIK